jgi:photosystem II stability/assembly factor-like uncharacterized protein
MARIIEFPPRLPDSFHGIPLCGGRVQSISVNPVNSNHSIVANQFGGLWKTENLGTNWVHLNALSTVFAVDVAYASNGNTVISTLARDNKLDNSGGIWVSPDGGYTWSKPTTAAPPSSTRIPNRISAYGISYAPDNVNKVYVGTDYGVAISNDNGSTWSHNMLENTSPLWRDKMQNSVRSVLALPNNKAIVLSGTGIYLSDDGGASWNIIRSGNFTFRSGFKNIDVSPIDSDKVFILQDYSNLLLYKVTDKRWTPISLPGGGSRGPFIRVSKNIDIIIENSIDIWIGAGVNLLKATCPNIDSVKKLTVSDWLVLWRPAGIHDDSGYLGLDNNKLPVFYGSDGGLFRPTNASATEWTRGATGGSGMNSYQITDLAGTNVREFVRGGGTAYTSLYFATQDNGIWASSDDGVTWPNYDGAEGFKLQVTNNATPEEEITVAYGKVGRGPSSSMFSDADLVNQRAVPDVDITGSPLSNMAQAFFISRDNWIRHRIPPGSNPEIYVSQNNGLNWRKKAEIALEVRGVFAVAGPSSDPTIYAPFKGARTTPDGNEIVGLINLRNVFTSTVLNYSDLDLIYLPDDGSLGVRATEFDWQAVYGVDPRNPRYIIAPDIYNNVIKVSRNGGAVWTSDINLTNEVTKSGRLLLYDEHPYRMQVTRISFDPYNRNRILVGTRDAGIIISEDGGTTWATIPGSEVILYTTNFFFKTNNTVIVSTYGRGLWKIDFRIIYSDFRDFAFSDFIEGPFIVRFFPDPKPVLDPIDWSDKDVTIFLNGRINGLTISENEVKMITVTPGTIFKRYVGKTKDYYELNITESEQGVGFNGLDVCLAALQNGEVIKGVILKENKILGIISGVNEFTENKMIPSYLFIATSLPIAGRPVLGSDGIIHLFGRGFKFEPGHNNYVTVMIDGQVIDQTAKVMQDGTVRSQLKVPEELSYDEHFVEIIQKVGDAEIKASSIFVKAAIDDIQPK